MSNNTKITEEQKKECFGSLENYESIAIKVAQILIDEIKRKSLEEYFKDIDIMNEFVYPYLQRWVEFNKDTIDKVLGMRKKAFTDDEIKRYISSNSVVSQELVELKFKEVFEGKGLTGEELERKEELENQPETLTKREAINKLQNEKEEQIQSCIQSYSEERFNSRLKKDINYGFIQKYSNPKEFELKLNGAVTPKVLKGNTEFAIQTNENGDYDFLVNQVQIALYNSHEVQPIKVYVPDKEYPEGMTLSDLIQKEKEEACEKALKALYEEFQQQGVDVSALSEKILGLDKDKEGLSK